MAITLDGLDPERALEELSATTGESLTDAAGRAIRERLSRVRAAKAQQGLTRDLMALVEEGRGAPVRDPRPLKDITDDLWE